MTDVRVRLAAVGYLNARPLYETLKGAEAAARFDIDCALPSEVARRISEDEADVALMPVAAAATIGDLRMARGCAIGARGPVRSVVIVSERPLEELEEVALDLSSRTSVVLARLMLRARLGGREPRFVGLSSAQAIANVGDRRGALVIGDPALAIEGKFAHVLDLGQAWYESTGLPFVFAAWCGRPGALTEQDERLLERAKVDGLERRPAIAANHASRSGLPEASLRAYLQNSIRYDFGDEERRGLERFFEDAARAGLLPATPVSFFDDDRRGALSKPSLDTVLSRAADGDRLSAAEGERILSEASFFDIGLAADAVRRRKHPHDVVTYIVDRNVNYTNVCTTSCRFCAFYRPLGHKEAWVLDRQDFAKKLQEVVDAGGVQILLQGGLHPELRIGWYEDLFRWIKSEFKLGLHALSPEEILHIGRLESLDVHDVLVRLHAAGLDSVPGGGAEILVDRVRRQIAKAKCTSDEWLGVMRVAHRMGLRSSATMMYGTVDTPRDRITHLMKLRDLQDETGGFTAFFCWDFQHERGTRIEAGDHGTVLYLRQQAVARILLDNIDHVGASWVTQGPEVGQVALRFGADDFGSVMFEENVVSSAGTTFCMNADAMERRIRAAGFKATRRNVLYDWLTPSLLGSMVRVIHADAVVLGDEPPLLDAAIVLDDRAVVVDVGFASGVLPRHGGAPVERVRGVVFPGLVNAHLHIELSALRGRVPGGAGFVPWVEKLIGARLEAAPEEDVEAVEQAVAELDAAGTIAVGEVTNSLAAVRALARRGMVGTIFHEVFGVEREALERRVASLPQQVAERVGEWPTPELVYSPTPHTLYSTHRDVVRRLVREAAAHGRRASIHLAEHPAERSYLERREGPIVPWYETRLGLKRELLESPGLSPILFAEELGVLAQHVLLVHLADARPDELERVARHEAPVVLCPRSNLFIETRLPPLLAMRRAGIFPALGTDSLASNASLDVLAEARALADRVPSTPSLDLLTMATWAGARALGRSDVGRIARGARPGILAVDGDPGDDPCAFLLRNVRAPRRWVARRGEKSR